MFEATVGIAVVLGVVLAVVAWKWVRSTIRRANKEKDDGEDVSRTISGWQGSDADRVRRRGTAGARICRCSPRF